MTFRFFERRRKAQPDATGTRLYYHFLDVLSGHARWRCSVSPIEGSFRPHSDGLPPISPRPRPPNRDSASLATLYGLTGIGPHGKAPSAGLEARVGFRNYGWQCYNEAAILYCWSDHPFTRFRRRSTRLGRRPTSGTHLWSRSYAGRSAISFRHAGSFSEDPDSVLR